MAVGESSSVRCHHEQAIGPATILAIGKANPPTRYAQEDYPDFYFSITNSSSKTELKNKFARICRNSGVENRYFHCSEEILRANSSLCSYKDASLDVRQDMAVRQVPLLAEKAATRALKEWGQSRSQITHLVFATTTGVNMPGADLTLSRLLGLRSTVKRSMLYQAGSAGGATVLRVAKDLAENNKAARVLAVVCELSSCITFRGPSEEHIDGLLGAAVYGDGAAALVIGSDPIPQVETPLFEVHWSGETVLPESDGAIEGRLNQAGLILHHLKDIAGLVSKNTLPIFTEATEVAGSPHWNDMFWAVHPENRAVLDELERSMKLLPTKLMSSRKVLRNYGNMSGASLLFALDEVRNCSMDAASSTTGQGYEWGLVVGFGPGVTVEVSLLKSVSVDSF